MAIHPPIHRDEAELASVSAELDEGRADEVDGFLVPEIHFGDPPLSLDAHLGSSPWVFVAISIIPQGSKLTFLSMIDRSEAESRSEVLHGTLYPALC
jgi:hypothetical protein